MVACGFLFFIGSKIAAELDGEGYLGRVNEYFDPLFIEVEPDKRWRKAYLRKENHAYWTIYFFAIYLGVTYKPGSTQWCRLYLIY